MKEKVVHFSEVQESPVEMEGAKNVFIRWLVSEKMEHRIFILGCSVSRKVGILLIIATLTNMRSMFLAVTVL